MRILYIAKHGSGHNDDEGAIAYALGALGHNVMCVNEGADFTCHKDWLQFILFHKYSDMQALASFKCPKVFWYFDLVDCNDATLQRRCAARKHWMATVIPYIDLGFCTDGDWVAQDRTGRLVQLCQGFDERLEPAIRPAGYVQDIDVLFAGTYVKCGADRVSFMGWLEKLAEKYTVMSVTNYFRQDLAQLIARSRIVVAPDSPVTSSYCSNRVYTVLGLGGFLLHPACKMLEGQYDHASTASMVYYYTREQLRRQVEFYLGEGAEYRAQLVETGRRITLEKHLYRHRCEQLIAIVKERLGCAE